MRGGCCPGARWLPVACVIFGVAGWAVPGGGPAQEAGRNEKLWVYVGTYTGGKSKGIYRLELDLATGKPTSHGLAAEATNPSFLAIHPTHKVLYAVGEVDNFGG